VSEGGLYLEYTRFAQGEEVFADPEEAVVLLDLLSELERREQLQVLVWCLVSNHFHLAFLGERYPCLAGCRRFREDSQGCSSVGGRDRGRLWQSRYQTRLVDSQRHLEQLVL
jgi:hypothetical protein